MTMAGAGKKVWRDAATLILTAKSDSCSNISHKLSKSAELSAPRECSDYFNYKVLMLKRSSKSKFMPNAYVFPGGVISKADFASGWRNLFKDFGYTEEDLEELVLKDVDRPLLMRAEVDEAILRDIGLRISAIRETFEESGVLLLKSSNKSSSYSEAFTFSNISQLRSWSTQVHSSPEKLLDLYREIGAVPDLWSLKEWADWLTPTDLHEQGKRRFDTLFYTTCLDTIPSTLSDQVEVTRVQWTDPATLLHQFYDRQLWLAPPQVYELSRLLHFQSQHDLALFSNARHQAGLTTWLPVRMKCDDGMVSLLPGDSLYPVCPDYEGSPSTCTSAAYSGTLGECLQTSGQVNRLEFRDSYSCVPRVTCLSSHGHVQPWSYQHFQTSHLHLAPPPDCCVCTDSQRRFCLSQPCSNWQMCFSSPELNKKKENSKLEERFMQKTREYLSI